jgi:hypothetical protein
MKRWLSSLVLVLLLAGPALAVNKIYVDPETAITFGDSAQTPTVTITLSALASAAGRVSAQLDRGATARAMCYRWEGTFQLTGTNVVGATIDLYLATSNGSHVDGEVGTADAALSSVNKLLNLRFMGSVIVDQTTTNTDMTGSGTYCTSARYFSLVVYDNTTLPLKTDTATSHVTLTPIPMEIQ